MFRRFPPPSGLDLAWLVGAAGAGALGLLPGSAGALDATSVLAWLALLAAAAGAGLGRRGLALFPFALAVPAGWSLVLLLADAQRLATPLWALFAIAGLFALGHAGGRLAGRLWPEEEPRAHDRIQASAGLGLAGLVLLAGLLASGASVGFGLARAPTERPPAWATRALDLSPIALVLECAGLDWSHGQPDVYAHAGIEWTPRRPWRGVLAGPTVLVVGCALSWLVAAGRRPR